MLGKSPKASLHLHKSLICRLGAGNENRTRMASLEGWSFTIKLCPRVANGTKRCHGVAGSQAVFSRQAVGRTVKHDRTAVFPLVSEVGIS